MREHYAALGLAVPNFAERLRCYEIHIGLVHMAYCTFARRPADLRAVVERTRQVLQGDLLKGRR